MRTVDFSYMYNIPLRTVQWYIKNNNESLDRKDIITVRNRDGKRLQYTINDHVRLKNLIKKK